MAQLREVEVVLNAQMRSALLVVLLMAKRFRFLLVME